MSGSKAKELRYPRRDWNTADFIGKYHSSRIANKLAPIPGTQLSIEKNHEDDLKAYHDKKDSNRDQRQKSLETKLYVKQQSALLQTNVYFDTVFGQNIRAIEGLLAESEGLLHNDRNIELKDDAAALMKFKKNIEQGSHYYIGFAISNGFQSINYQDPDNGNTFLHLAVKKGYDKVVEELLKYKANPDAKNKLGNYPVHEAWLFWNTDQYRTKEQRLDQERRTCQILLHLFSYGAYVDAADLTKQTPLHIACRLGPVRAVKIILTFRCDTTALTTSNLSASEIAQEFHQKESYKLLQAWDGIRSYLLRTDFHSVWHKFLHDHEASMMLSKPAAAIISEMELEENARHMARAGREGVVFVDDPLLIRAMQASREQEAQGKVPKPWEKDWKKFVKISKAEGVIDLKSKLDGLKSKVKGQKKVNRRIGMTEVEIRRSRLPDRPTPLTWDQRQIIANGGSLEGEQSLPAPRIMPFGGSADEEVEGDEDEDEDEDEKDDFYSALHHFPDKLDVSSNAAVFERRRAYAQSVGRDAKFLKFTKRLTQDSALALPLRTPQAPMQGTEEEDSALRMIVAQGFEFDRLEKYKKKDAFAELLGTHKEPAKDKLGAYSEEVQFSKLNPRDVLYDSLFLAAQAAAAEAVTEEEKELLFPAGSSAAPSQPNVKTEPDKRNKMDLVNSNRPRYVDKALLPAKQEASAVEKMIREAKEKEEREKLKKLNLTSEAAREMARQAMEAEIVGAQARLDDVDKEEKAAHALLSEESSTLRAASRHRQRSMAEKRQSMRKLFLAKQEVKYGQGRLTSSHNLQGRIEEPWGTIGGRYLPLSGDRTV